MENPTPPAAGPPSSPDSASRHPQTIFRPAPLVVVSGPSGVGKTTVVDRLLSVSHLPLRRAVTATTRTRRENEIPEVSYHFWGLGEFRKAIDDGRMLEWELVFGTDLYGTPRSEVDPYRAAGTGVILVIDVKGAARLRELCGDDQLSVFIQAPSFEVLEGRLRGRQDMPEDRILRRLETAREEMARAGEFHHLIVNQELEQAVRNLEVLIENEFTKRGAC